MTKKAVVSSVKSPCIKNCCLDDEDICLGCFRSIDEILAWSSAKDPQRKVILKCAMDRRAQHVKQYPSKYDGHFDLSDQ